ncbi:MAG TPA: ABC transporter permease [Candidatus Limnocylindrales bacterium]|nr:ABC transporter permease [Candidatus Limnocylindrales bacterium]
MDFMQDVRYGLRMLAKSPGFTAVAVLSLTLGIGANTTIFTLTKAIFLQSVPVKNPSRVVSLYSTAQSHGGPLQEFLPTPVPNARDYREKNEVFSGSAIAVFTGMDLTISGKQEQLFGEVVNSNLFDVLGVQPVIGREFSPEEDTSPRPVVIISYALWGRQFGNDPDILGKAIQLDQQEYSIIGVMPASFHDVGVLGSPDFWVPMSMHDQALNGAAKDFFNQRAFRMASMVGRLKPGVTLAQAQASIHTLGLQLEKEYPKDNGGRNEELVPLDQTGIPPQVRSVFVKAGTLMMVIVGLVLLIACANVANLLLARATQRQREIGVRLALGASRARLIRQLLTESLLLGLTAGALGILVAYWGRKVLVSLLPPGLAQRLDLSLDARVFLYTFGLALVATVLFGLVPALEASKPDRIAELKDRTGAPTGSTRWYGLRGILVMVQVALSLIALVGAGLFIHSLSNAQKINPGFEVQHAMVAFLNMGAEHYKQPQAEQFYKDVIERLNQLPMVEDATLTDTAPFGGNIARTTFTDGVDSTDPRNGKLTPIVAVEPGFFKTEGIALLRGRAFTESDDAQGALVAVVNKALTQQMWPGEDPLGKHLHFLGETWDVTVVGEVNTVKYATLGEPPQAIVYFPLKQDYSAQVVLFVHTKGEPAKALPSIRSTVNDLAPGVPLQGVRTVSEVLVNSLTAPRVGAELLGGFGLLALVLAAIGTYGVMSYSVSQRSQEIGIRMALGAQPMDVLRLILASGLAMVLAGVVVGLALSSLLARSMGALLFGIGAFDAPSFLITAALLIGVAMAACFVPARRAMRVDPLVALRYE